MKKRLFNIHKLIGINIVLFFFISLFFGIFTIFQPYINIWEDSKKHFKEIPIENIPLDKCIKQVTKRVYFAPDGKKVRNDIIKLDFPSKEVRATNLVRIKNRPNFYLDPKTCKRVRPKFFTISKFFDKIHTGAIFRSLIFKIIFGFMSVAVIFLSLSGIFLIIKNRYRNKKTKSAKGFFAKYHRLLLMYTLPLVFMFGLTGALFNLGVYSSPLITSYLTHGKTANVLRIKRNILVDPDLKTPLPSKKIKGKSLNELYLKAKDQFEDIRFYSMQVYNYNDINEKVKFIGYEPKNLFISSMVNETYIILDGINGKVLEKKVADQGSFAQKTLDTIFYLHYLRTFKDFFPRLIFAILCLVILVGIVYSVNLWLERSKKDRFSYRVLKPLSLSIILGSLLSVSLLFATNWLIPKSYLSFNLFNKLIFTQEVIFYMVYLLTFIYIFIKKSPYEIIKNSFLLSSTFFMLAFIFHDIFSGFNIFKVYKEGIYEVLFTDIFLIVISLALFLFSKKLPKKYIGFR